MDKLITNITSYFDYLRSECGLTVSAHFDGKDFNRIPDKAFSALLTYNSHDNPYCVAVKGSHHGKCLLHQKGIIKNCKDKSFCRSCHAGVLELIYPIVKENTPIGYVAVSGYRQKELNPRAYNKRLWEKALGECDIPKQRCDAIIPPLCLMLEILFTRYAQKPADEYNMMLQFLNEYHNNITLTDLCNHLGRSKSHISHIFKRESGMTLSSYCNILKLNDAKKLLTNTDIPITEIAFDVGFNDVSYFIYLFRKKFGISPLQYRKKQ